MTVKLTAYRRAFDEIENHVKTHYVGMTDIDEADQKKGEEFAQTFLDFLNTLGHQDKAAYAVRKLVHNHPTLQQSVMRFCVAVMENMAAKDTGIDGRNKQSHKIAQMFVEAVPYEERYLGHV